MSARKSPVAPTPVPLPRPDAEPPPQILRLKGREIHTRTISASGKETAVGIKPRRSREETLCVDGRGRLFLQIDTWRGGLDDWKRRKHRLRVRRLGRIAALCWYMEPFVETGRISPGARKVARAFWASISQGKGVGKP